MGTRAAEPHFVDANILIYARNTGSPFHAAAVSRLAALRATGHELWTSRQCLREYVSGVSRPGTFLPPLYRAEIVADVTGFIARLRLAEDGPRVTAELLGILQSVAVAGKQVHDANIVATRVVNGVRKILTHNVSDFTRYAPRIAVVPLLTPLTPSSVSPPPGPP